MPTLAPRRKTAPGRDSPSLFLMSAVSLMKPIFLEPKRSMDWTVIDFRLYGDLWNGWALLEDCWEKFSWRICSQFCDRRQLVSG